jgi:DNA-binding NarL/FixJ family response regulator
MPPKDIALSEKIICIANMTVESQVEPAPSTSLPQKHLVVIHADRLYAETLMHWLQESFPEDRIVWHVGFHLALRELKSMPADMCIFDLDTFGDDWYEFMMKVTENLLTRHILVLTTRKDDTTLGLLSRMKLDGVMDVADEGIEAFKRATRSITNGETYFSPAFRLILCEKQPHQHTLLSLLTATERLVLACVGAGLANEEIGAALGCKVSTVNVHRRSLMRKLAVHRSAELKQFALQFGIVQFFRGAMLRPGFDQTLFLRNLGRKAWLVKKSPKITD